MDEAVQAVEGMRGLLKSVSRSFYLSIKWLPAPMRHGVSLGYMLARATDSVADTSTADAGVRRQVLLAMGRAVEGELPPEQEQALLQTLATTMAGDQEKDSERILLTCFGECLEALRHTAAEEASLIRQVLATIIQGQLWDLSYFTPDCTCVADDAATRTYTYQVAGCVGGFWTRLGYATMGAGFCDPAPERRALMEEAGVRYGCGLQLVNILRDRAEDATRGRSYLVEGADTARWMSRAGRYLQDGVDYSTRLRGFRLRFASMLPALIGLKTIALMRRTSHEPKVKIPRRAVYLTMLQAAWLSLFPR